MKIGELAQLADCGVETIRYYERQGLLSEPGRTEGNYRDYSQAHLERLQFIRNCRGLDMGHDEIKTLLRYLDSPQEDCSGANAVVVEHLEHVRQRIRELESLAVQLLSLQKKCQRANKTRDCGILIDLGNQRSPRPKRTKHLASSTDIHQK